MKITSEFFYYNHAYLQPLLKIDAVSEEFENFCNNFKNPHYRIFLVKSNLYLYPDNSINHATSPEMFDDFLNELEKQGFISTENRQLFSHDYTNQYQILPHIGKERAHYQHSLHLPTNIQKELDIEQADFSDEISFLTASEIKYFNDKNIMEVIANCKLYLKKLTWLLHNYQAQQKPSAYFLRTNLKQEALKTMPHPFIPGEYTWMDFLCKGIYRDDKSSIDPAQLQPIKDFISSNPQYQPLFLAASLWAIFGSSQRLGKTKIPDELMQLRIFQHIHADNFLDEYFNNKNGIYNQQHSIYLTEIKDDASRSTFIHELVHALANLIYDNHLELFPNNEEKAFAWKKVAEDLLSQLFSLTSKPEINSILLKLANFSSYEKHLWTQELAARWLQVLYLNQNSELRISKEIREFIGNEFEIFIRNTKNYCKNTIEECGLYYLEAFRNSQFFQTQDKIILDQTACDLLQAAFTRKLTIIDIIIEKLLREQQSTEQIIDHLHNNYITEYAILLSAAESGQLAIAKALLEKFKIDLNDIRTIKAFNTAAKNGHLEMVKLFITAGINTSGSHEQQLTALHYAAAKGHLDIIKLLLQHNADVMTCDRDGNTALHWAAQSGHVDILKFLTNDYIKINTKNKINNTPLHLAAKHGYFHVVKHLLDNKAEINAINADGDTPLHLAAVNEREGIVELLLKNNCHVNVANKAGCSPLYLAVRNANDEIIQTLLDCRRINVNLATVADISPLHLAIASQQTDTALKLLKNPTINVKSQNCWGDNALHAAAVQNDLKVIKALLDLKKLDINGLNQSDSTALHLALANGAVEAAELLIQCGANINAEDANGNSPLHTAVKESNHQALELLLHINSNEPIFANAKNHKGKTALHLAVGHGNNVIVQLLLENSDAYINGKTPKGETSLHIAIRKDYMDSAELLIQHPDMDINAADAVGNTALYAAIEQGKFAFAKLLITSETLKVNVNAKNLAGTTPLHIAVQTENEELVQLLLARPDIDFKATDAEGNSAEDYAKAFANANGSSAILKLIQKKYDEVKLNENTSSFWSTPPNRASDSDNEHDEIEITSITLTYADNSKFLIKN